MPLTIAQKIKYLGANIIGRMCQKLQDANQRKGRP